MQFYSYANCGPIENKLLFEIAWFYSFVSSLSCVVLLTRSLNPICPIVTHSMTFHGIMQSTWGQPDATIFDMHALARISLLNVNVNFHWIEILYIGILISYSDISGFGRNGLNIDANLRSIHWFNLKHKLFLYGKKFSRFLEAILALTSLKMFCLLCDNIWMCSHNCYPDVCQFQMKSDSIAFQSNDFFAWFFRCVGIDLVHWIRSIWWDIKPLLFFID